jgi:hypothetical protein
VKPHTIVGPFDWWGACPGSLMALPLDDAAQAALADYAATIDRAAARRDAADKANAERQRRAGTPQPRRAQRPRPPKSDPYWFRNSG